MVGLVAYMRGKRGSNRLWWKHLMKENTWMT